MMVSPYPDTMPRPLRAAGRRRRHAGSAAAKAVEPPVAFGEKETESAVGLHPTTYNADETSSREDRQLGKKGVRGILGRIVSLIFFFTQQRANVVESRATLFQIDKLIENFYITSAEGLIH